MNLTDKGMQLKKGSRPSEKAAGKVLKTQEKDAKERCPDCGEIGRGYGRNPPAKPQTYRRGGMS